MTVSKEGKRLLSADSIEIEAISFPQSQSNITNPLETWN